MIAEEQRMWLRISFLEYYFKDKAFCLALKTLSDSYPTGFPGDVNWWFVKQKKPAWGSQVSRFCEEWGLTFQDQAMEHALHGWCKYRNEGGDRFKLDWIISGLGCSVSLPETGDPPTVSIDWDPTCESRKNAEKRVQTEVDLLMKQRFDEINTAHETMSKPPQERWARKRHLEWLFLRQRHAFSYEAIAKEVQKKTNTSSRQAVSEACKRLADEMGLRIRPKAAPSLE